MAVQAREGGGDLEEGEPMPPVPIDICVRPTTRALIITGPNTGGKTATLKVASRLLLMRYLTQ